MTLELPNKEIVKAQAIIVDKETEISYYILGNEIQKQIENSQNEKILVLNAVITRSKNRNETIQEKKREEIEKAVIETAKWKGQESRARERIIARKVWKRVRKKEHDISLLGLLEDAF